MNNEQITVVRRYVFPKLSFPGWNRLKFRMSILGFFFTAPLVITTLWTFFGACFAGGRVIVDVNSASEMIPEIIMLAAAIPNIIVFYFYGYKVLSKMYDEIEPIAKGGVR